MPLEPVVFFGGTFDPIHIGHLRTALELGDWLDVSQVHLVPSGEPVHRSRTLATAQQRYEMVKLATEHEPMLVADDIEIRSTKDSYSVLTLESMRRTMASEQPLIMVMGSDAFVHLASWFRWRELFELCHIVVVARPGYQPELNADLADEVQPRLVSDTKALKESAAGKVMFHQLTPLGVSATQIRELINEGQNPRFLLPERVWEFIKKEKLYGFEKG